MRTRCPTVKPYFWAVPASITTSSGVVGGPPAIRCRLEICWSVSKLIPRVGAPPVEIALPSGADELGVARDLAVGGRDAGHAAHRGQQRLGQFVLRTAFPPLPSWATPRTWKSILE